MYEYKAVAESNSFIVLDKYGKDWQVNESYQSEYDLEREKYFLALGIKTLRFWNYEIDNDFQKVKNKIMEELQKMPDQEDPLKVIFK